MNGTWLKLESWWIVFMTKRPKAKDYDILIACECSGQVRDAMIHHGLKAISCDIKPSQSPGPHYKGDVRDILHLPWPALIAHPDCKFLANSGAKHLYKGMKKENGKYLPRWRKMKEAAQFFKLFDQAKHIPIRAVENPIMVGHAIKLIGRKADQFVQPWWFGDPFTKATGWWLTGLPKLPKEYEKSWYEDRGIEIIPEVWRMGPSEDREEKRSKFYPGMSRALAQYWGPIIKATI